MNYSVTNGKYDLAAKIWRNRYQKVAFIQPKNLGDCLLLCSVAANLQNQIDAQVTIYTKEQNRQIVKLFPQLLFEKFEGGPLTSHLVLGCKLLLNQLKTRTFIFNASESSSGMFIGLLNKNHTASFVNLRHPVLSSSASKYSSKLNLYRREKIDQYQDLVMTSPFGPKYVVSTVKPKTFNKEGRTIVVNPESRWKFKSPNQAIWTQLLQRIKNRYPEVDLILVGDAINTELSGIEAIDLRGNTTIIELTEIIDNASYFIGCDSLAGHIANLCSTPGVVLFGPTDSHIWGHQKGSAKPFCSDLFSCVPCNQDGCDGSKVSQCLQYDDREINLLFQRVSTEIDHLL